jgi:hypothetical protein
MSKQPACDGIAMQLLDIYIDEEQHNFLRASCSFRAVILRIDVDGISF